MQTSLSIPQLSAAFCFALASCGPDNSKLSAPDDGMPAQDRKVTADAQIPYVHAAWKTGIAQNSVKLTSITSGDYADLLFLEQTIGNRRLVQLGESGHGVAEFNQIKVRLIKFLHEHVGFDVIAFESGLSECFFTNVNDTAPSPAQMIGSVFRVWRTEEVLELFEYLGETKESDNPLTLAGFDFQMSGDWSERRDLLKSMVALFDKGFAREFSVTDTEFAAQKQPNDVPAMRKYVRDNEDRLVRTYKRLEELLGNNMAELARRFESNPLMPLFAHQIAVSMVAYIDFWLQEDREMQIRDQAMADNVEFLLKTAYPDQKVIIWAHNLHIRHNSHLVSEPDRDGFRSMGTLLKHSFPEQMYTVGLYMYQGRAAYVDGEHYEVASHAPNSLEAILHAAGAEYLFVDMKHAPITAANDWMATEISTKTWGLHDERLIPKAQYDALIFIDTVTPPKYLE